MKWIILLGVFATVLGTVWYVGRNQRYEPPWAKPKFGEVTTGDIRVPIAASGLIHANQLIEMKPEASGEVVGVPVVEGDFVKQGDKLVILDPEDEQRTVDRAQADYDRTEALLRQANVAIDRANVGIDNAKARVAELEAQQEITKYELDKLEAWVKEGRTDLYNEQQLHDAQSRQRMSEAQVETARIAVRNAELTKEDAIAARDSQEALLESAKKSLEEARQRLDETTVYAPQAGIITQVYVKSGNLVQSGTQSLTGGTPLMNLADVSRKMVIARLDEADYGRVLDISPLDAMPETPNLREAAREDAAQMEKRSGRVKIRVDAFPEDVFEGRIERVEPQGKLNAGSSIIQFDVHVEITDERKFQLPLGAQAQVEFTVESAIDALRVPAEAVQTRDDERGVYKKIDAPPGEKYGKQFIPCRFGITDGEFTQVIEVLGDHELDTGDTVYTKLPQDPDERD
jgi:HlyD family secretion protein